MRTLISLISEQSLPNVLFIKQLGPFERHIFLTTAKMEQKRLSDAVMKSCELDGNKVRKLVVSPEHVPDIMRQLDAEIGEQEDIVLHLTGGTKIMALAAYAVVTGRKDPVPVFYIPLDSNHIQQIYPSPGKTALTVKLNLPEYLDAYGVKVVDKSLVEYDRRKSELAETFIQKLSMDNIPPRIKKAAKPGYKKEEKPFLLGGWLEYWLALAIRNHFRLGQDEIWMNMKITRGDRKTNESTEYDVMFVKNNKLYIAECKFFSNGRFNKEKINKDWYKLAGLQLHLGLYAKPFFVTPNKVNQEIKNYLQKTMPLYRIKSFADIDLISNTEGRARFFDALIR